MSITPTDKTSPIDNTQTAEGKSSEIENIPNKLGESTDPVVMMSAAKKIDNAIVFTGRAASATVGIPIAVIGKLTGGLISGVVGLTAGFVGLLGAGVGYLLSKGEKKGVLKGAEVAFPVAIGVGTLLTPINAVAKFVENFGKALIPEDVKPKAYDKFNKSFKTSIYPQEINIGKKAAQYGPGRTLHEASGKLGRAQKSGGRIGPGIRWKEKTKEAE